MQLWKQVEQSGTLLDLNAALKPGEDDTNN